jgi:hypothetical protein
MRATRRWLGILLLGLLLFAPAARAASDPVGGGQATLRLSPALLSFLKADGVKLSVSAPAKLKGKTITLPSEGGLVDPTTAKGKIDQGGAIVFAAGKRRLPLRDIRIQTKHTPLIAKVGGSQLKVASAPKLSFARAGFESKLSVSKLLLTAKLITRLNKKLRPKVPFKEGALLGSATSITHPLTTTIQEGGRATLLFDPSFIAKLQALEPKVSLNPVFPAEHEGPSFTFPIIRGGQIAPDASQGTLRTGGEVELLQLGGGQVLWHEPWLDLGAKTLTVEPNVLPSPPFGGKGLRSPIASLGQGAVSSDPAQRTIMVSGAPLTLEAGAAKTLNEALDQGKEAFRGGEALGVVGFTAQGQ